MHEPAKILIADDEPHIRRILQFLLEQAGYQVVLAADGRQALSQVAAERPDLALLDVMMPRLDGFEVLEQLRRKRDSRRLPVIMLTARGDSTARVKGLQDGANDYVGKPFDHEELLARVGNLLEAFQAQREANPLTGLPGNPAIEREIQDRLSAEAPFAALYADLDHFKSYNDRYGYARGDAAIELLARILCQEIDQIDPQSGFVGHVGGDDFVVVCASDRALAFATRVIARFDVEREEMHDPEDWQRGHLVTLSRTGAPHEVPLMSLTVALVEDVHQRHRHLAGISDALAELKRHGKQQQGSVVARERRTAGASSELIHSGEASSSVDH